MGKCDDFDSGRKSAQKSPRWPAFAPNNKLYNNVATDNYDLNACMSKEKSFLNGYCGEKTKTKQ